MQFGIYYIPPDGEFYRLGSQLIGYDIRRKERLDPPEWLLPEWTEYTQKYGFHLTITDAVTISSADLPKIEQKIKDVLRCFRPQNAYELEMCTPPVRFWPTIKTQAALHAHPSTLVSILHTTLVCTVQMQGRGSLYSTQLIEDSGQIPPYPQHQAQKIKLFFGPYILDDFRPHFTLLNPYEGEQHIEIENKLNTLIERFGVTIGMKSLCLVTREGPQDFFEIHREFPIVY